MQYPGEQLPALPRNEWDLGEEQDQLRRLLKMRQQSIASLTQQRPSTARNGDLREEEQETIISVPLLMHWVSQIDPEKRKTIQTLGDVYRLILEKH